MGKQTKAQNASTSGNERDDIRVAVMDAITDTKLLATLAEWVADGGID